MEQAEIVKLLLAAVVGGLLKELVAWLISFSKVSLLGLMWKHSRSVLMNVLACSFYGVVLFRFGITETAATRIDVLIMIGCALGLLICAFALLISVAHWMHASKAANTVPSTSP